MPEKNKMRFAANVSAQEAADYLDAIARGLREHSMLIESGDTSIAIEVGDDIKLDLEVSSDPEKGKASVDVSLSWRARREAEAVTPPGLTIVPGAAPAEAPTFAE